MVTLNYQTKEINCKIVYYGPGLGGKTTNLQIIHRKVPEKNRSEMLSLATESDRTLFFDFLPLDLGNIKGFSTKFQLYTVPGQVYYNETRKLVLRGVDGIVFVADSQKKYLQETIQSLQNLQDNLHMYGQDLAQIPHIIQYNKRDCPDILTIAELDQWVNKYRVPTYEAVASKGIGVFDTLKAIGKLVIDHYNQQSKSSAQAETKYKKKTDAVSPSPEKTSSPVASVPPPVVPPSVSESTSFTPMRARNPAGRAPAKAPEPSIDPISTKPPTKDSPQSSVSSTFSPTPKPVAPENTSSLANGGLDDDILNYIKTKKSSEKLPPTQAFPIITPQGIKKNPEPEIKLESGFESSFPTAKSEKPRIIGHDPFAENPPVKGNAPAIPLESLKTAQPILKPESPKEPKPQGSNNSAFLDEIPLEGSQNFKVAPSAHPPSKPVVKENSKESPPDDSPFLDLKPFTGVD